MSALRAIRAGALWGALNGAVSIVLPFLIFAYFARLMPPGEFGVIATGLAAAEVLKSLAPQGLYEDALGRGVDDEEARRAIGGVMIASGLAAACLYAFGVFSAWEYAGIGNLMLLGFAFKILFDLGAIQPQIELARRADFTRIALSAILGNLLGAAGSLLFSSVAGAFAGLISYYALSSAATFLTLVLRSSTLARPALTFNLRSVSANARYASGVRLFGAVSNYVDQLVVATLVPARSTGFYNFGKRFELLFITVGGALASALVQPLLARSAGDQLAPSFARCLAILTIVCGAPAAIAVFNHNEFVPLLFGAQWTEAAPAVAVFALSGFARALGGVHGALLSVSGRNRELLVYAAAAAASTVALVAATAWIGVIWCAVALLARNILLLFWAGALVRRQVAPLGDIYLRRCIGPFLLMTAAAAAGHLSGAFLGAGAPGALPPLATIALSSLATAGAAAFLFFKKL